MTNREGISPKDFAVAIGVSESSVKRWVDQGLLRAVRTAGGHRRIAPEEAARWIREHRVQPIHPERVGFKPELPPPGESLRGHVDTFHDYLAAGRIIDTRSLALRLFLAGQTVASIADELIAPAMNRLGVLWQHGPEGVFVEHRAVDLAVHVVKEIDGVSIEQNPRHKGPPAVGAGLSHDPYLLAPMLASAVLGEVGYRATNLGPDTPVATLELAAQKLGARMIYISVSIVPDPALVAEVQGLVQRLVGKDMRVALGGRHVDALQIVTQPGLVHVGTTMLGLAAFGRSCLASAARG